MERIALKAAGAILLLLGTTAFGIYKACMYNSRLDNLYEIKKAFLYIQGEIRYMNTPMPETLAGAARQIKGSCRLFFSRVASELDAGNGKELKQVWDKAVVNEIPQGILEREAVEALREMGGQLGCLDIRAQEKAIDYFLKRWDFLIEKGEKLKLYYACGVMVGLLMVIIIV